MVLAQFVCHRNKIPYNPQTGKRADTTQAGTWGSFAEALAAYARADGRYDGLGLVLADGISGVDLDHCRDAETGAIDAWAQAIIDRLDSYTEVSPSGTGIHILCAGAIPEGRNRTGHIEMYQRGRFFTLTGEHLAGTPTTIEPRSAALAALHAELFPEAARDPHQPSTTPASRPVSLSDQVLLEKATNPQTSAGREVAALWAGDWAGKKSASEADFALARHLAWWTRHDAPRVAHLMRSSGLAREKWDKKDGAYGTHLERTIAQAILSLGSRMYSGAASDFDGCQDDTSENGAPAQETSAPSPDCDAKDKIIAQLRRELAKERERVKQLEGELAWERKMRANKHLSPAQKIVGSVLREQWQKAAAKGPQDEMPVHLPTLAKQTGLSERTVSTTIVQFHAMGAAKREEKHPIAETGPNKGKRVTRLYVDPRPLLQAPEAVQPEKPRNHGGRRVCPECGSKHLRVRIRAQVTCMECGNKWETESAERILRGDENENCALTSVQIRDGKNLRTEEAFAPGMNHHDERAAMLALVESLGWQTRIPVRLENVGGTAVRWREFADSADNSLIDDALHSLRIRADAFREAVS